MCLGCFLRSHVIIAVVRKKAEQLPKDGIPPEIVRLLPHDASLDKVLIQNAAAPVDGRGSLETAGARLDKSKPNAVVEEKSGCDDADINAQRIAAVRSFAERLTGEQQIITMGDSTSQEARASKGVEMPARTGMREAQGQDADARETSQSRAGDHGRRLESYAVITGNAMVDQFRP